MLYTDTVYDMKLTVLDLSKKLKKSDGKSINSGFSIKFYSFFPTVVSLEKIGPSSIEYNF